MASPDSPWFAALRTWARLRGPAVSVIEPVHPHGGLPVRLTGERWFADLVLWDRDIAMLEVSLSVEAADTPSTEQHEFHDPAALTRFLDEFAARLR